MSLHDLMISDVSDVFIQTDDFADVCRRYKNGERTDGANFNGIITPLDADPTDAYGKGKIQRATLVCSESIKFKEKDAISHNGFRYEVDGVSDPEHGMQTISLVRYVGEERGARQLRTGDL